ncbi:hypothetical protein J7T55_002937 [Diaporthe amygdali]|uniref:uncharacterized protein n=1 Tax=Phomopsis amygdali TaxID=1214568 RepID=UPI0022FE9E6F|nr:uncharacterized protein J7T55_002937 [Diaporthe amygdali]KAJ0122424.1 hypothetical protein J7T55_002937 [Diaporthe amygdali]
MCERKKFNKRCGKCNTVLISDVRRNGDECDKVRGDAKLKWGDCGDITEVSVADEKTKDGDPCWKCAAKARAIPEE